MTAPASPTKVRGETVLAVDNLVKHFPISQGVLFKKQTGAVRAVDGVSFELRRGETLAWSASPAAASRPWPGC